jgi:excisionase family DNA binding protein
MTKKSPAQAGAAPAVEPQIEWMRVREACEYSRISKPKLYSLMNRGLIRSVSLRERGMIRGTRLISFDSLRDFLESRATGGASTEE